MPEYPCHCGERFSLPKKKHKQILAATENFCSGDCLLSYINDFTPNAHGHKYIAPVISLDYEYWDLVSRSWFRSSYEAIVAHFFHTNGIETEYEKYGLRFRGKVYTPDFYIPDRDLFVEVKGLWAMSSKKKLTLCIECGYNIILIPSYLVRRLK